jgi:hypothetical protein
MAEKIREIKQYEPLRANRWILRMEGSKRSVPEYLFKDFKIENTLIVDEKSSNKTTKNAIKLTVTNRNSMNFLVKPDDMLDCKRVTIDFLDPTGVVINYYHMDVTLDSFTFIGDYSNSSILTNESVFWVTDIVTMDDEEETAETLKNYKDKSSK